MKRTSGILFILLVSLLSSCTCNKPENHQEGLTLAKELHVYNWTNVIPESVLREFEKKYGVKVVYDNFYSNEELLAKMQTRSHDYDVIFPSDYMVEIMVKQDMLERLDFANIPNFKNISSDFKGMFFDVDNKYSVPFQASTNGIAVNTERIKNFKPSWDLLFDPKYKGRISMLDDMRYGIIPAMRKLGYDVNTTDPQELEEVKKLMIKQKPLVKAYSSDTYIDLIKTSEVWLASGYSIDVLQIARENPNIRYILPQEGTARAVESMCIPKNSKRKYTAEVFINFIINEKVHAEIANYSLATCPNQAALKYVNPEARNNENIYPSRNELTKQTFLRDVGDATKLYDALWNEVKNQ